MVSHTEPNFQTSDAPAQVSETRAFWRNAVVFVAIGLVLYLGLLALAERQVRVSGERNPLFQISQMGPQTDAVILGASHAMPLGFEGIDEALEQASGHEVTTLAIEGGGIVPAAFFLDTMLRQTQPATVIYVVDSFAFLSPQWNEDRLQDNALFARAPYSRATFAELLADPAALPMLGWYLSGFDKVNALLRPTADRSEAELTKFDRTYRENPQIDDQRVAYLYPQASDDATERYLERLESMAAAVEAVGADFKLLLMPAPSRYITRLPAIHDTVMARITEITNARGIAIVDHSALLSGDENYYDTDHLNRTGATAYATGALAEMMRD